MNEVLNKIFVEIIDVLKKLEPKKNKNDEVIQRTALDYSTELLDKSPHKIISNASRIWIYYNGRYIPINSMAKTENFIKKCLMKFLSARTVSVKLITAVLSELFTEFHELHPYEDKNISYIRATCRL